MDNDKVNLIEYNTKRNKLILPEYGRNVQKMVDYAITIDDSEKRNIIAKAIISVMGSINPHLRDIEDNRHTLWDHLAIISDFKLNIDSPYPKPETKNPLDKPNIVPYKTNKIKFKHYGKTIELFINKAIEMEDGEEKDALIVIIANQMKKLFLIWNKESVSDHIIFDSLQYLSGHKLKIPENLTLVETKTLISKNKKRKPGKYSKSNDRRR
ncbi:DUF4290 domain-containing protein [Bacteroidota bacterium]